MSGPDFTDIFDRQSTRFIDELGALLRMPSISGDAAFEANCRECASWLRDHMTGIGLTDCKLLETPTKPVVYGRFYKGPSARNVFYYGHYDVQPAPHDWKPGCGDWISNPFEPVERDGRIFARGAQDNKGQLMYVLKAVETAIQQGTLNCNLEFFIEGEEESSSRGIKAILPELVKDRKGEVLLVCDSETSEPGTSGICLGIRGIVVLEIYVGGLSGDLHSGHFGGVVKNPATELARIVSSFHNPDGSIAVEGYQEGVPEITDEMRDLMAQCAKSDKKIKDETGVLPTGGEAGRYSPEVREALRPTIEINGFHGGYGGKGPMTIIPMEAIAKVTSRLVGTQNPEKCLGLLVEHIKRRAPSGLNLEVREADIGGDASFLDIKSDLVRLAREVLTASSGQPARVLWSGGSIPIVARFAKLAGVEPLMIGHGLAKDRIHQTNESFSREQFRLGYLGIGRLLGEL